METTSDAALSTVVSVARNGIDYTFFEMLSEKINQTNGDEKDQLTALRDKLLQLTAQIDKVMQGEMNKARQLLDTILKSPDVETAVMENIEEISDFFVETLKAELEAARKIGDLGRSSKLQQVVAALQKASAPPPEVALIDELMASEDEAGLNNLLEANSDKITPEFIQLLNNIVAQAEQQGQPPEIIEQVRQLYRAILQFSMKKNLN